MKNCSMRNPAFGEAGRVLRTFAAPLPFAALLPLALLPAPAGAQEAPAPPDSLATESLPLEPTREIRFTTAMLYAIGFVSLFVSGGLGGIFLAQPAVDIYLHDTYFVVGHFHLIMGVAAIFGMFAGTYYWFPKMFGRFMNETLGKVHFWFTFIGVYAIFMPMHFIGLAGHPRRYADTTGVNFLAEMGPVHLFITIVALVTVGAQIVFFLNFFWSMRRGKKAEINPWHATTLEWSVPSPPPHDNFSGRSPTIYRGAYEYSVPGAPQDYSPQHVPEGA